MREGGRSSETAVVTCTSPATGVDGRLDQFDSHTIGVDEDVRPQYKSRQNGRTGNSVA
jgi:hypothetical protein